LTTGRAAGPSVGRHALLLAAAVAGVAAVCVPAAARSAVASGHGQAGTGAVVVVTAGKPTELAFRLSRSSLLPWAAGKASERITFSVTNRGSQPHDFKVCTGVRPGATANGCAGSATRTLAPGGSATLAVTFPRRGTYEYLSTVRGDAAGGMKGLLGIGVRLPSTTPAGTTTVTTTTTTTAVTTTPSSLVGNANAGKIVFLGAGCAQCHILAAAGASGTSGPSLDALKPTQPVIVQYVTDGSTAAATPMPAYAGTLSPTQIDDLAAYVYLTTHTIN